MASRLLGGCWERPGCGRVGVRAHSAAADTGAGAEGANGTLSLGFAEIARVAGPCPTSPVTWEGSHFSTSSPKFPPVSWCCRHCDESGTWPRLTGRSLAFPVANDLEYLHVLTSHSYFF